MKKEANVKESERWKERKKNRTESKRVGIFQYLSEHYSPVIIYKCTSSHLDTHTTYGAKSTKEEEDDDDEKKNEKPASICLI